MAIVTHWLYLLNFLLFIFGVILIIAGYWLRTEHNDYLDFFEDGSRSLTMLAMVVGSVLFSIGLFGCRGIRKGNRLFLKLHSLMLMTLLILEILIIYVAIKLKTEETEVLLQNKMVQATANYNKSVARGVTRTWNFVQEKLKCCGAMGPEDWLGNVYIANGSTPDSCCKKSVLNCGQDMATNINSDIIYTEGCFSALKTKLQSETLLITKIVFVIVVIEIVSIVCSSCMAGSI